MAGELAQLVMLPRYTTLVGAIEFKTSGIDVNDYINAIVNLWRGQGAFGMLATFEESSDQIDWTTCAGTETELTIPQEDETQVVAHLQKRWFRLKLRLTGSDPRLTCWAIGALKMRQS